MEQGTTENGVFGAKLMWQYLGDFVGLLRGIPDYRGLPLTEILPAAFPELTFVRVVRANKIRQAVSLWKAVQTASWSDHGGDQAPSEEAPYRAYLEEMKPQLRFHYRAISHLLDQILVAEANWDAFFEHTRIRPILVLYENFYADYAASTLNILDRLGLEPPPEFAPEPQMRRQSDGINDDWARRFSELRLGTEFDLVPAQGGER
jgi:LPS sulfotransferase NodH